MEEKELNSWSEFEGAIAELELQRARLVEKNNSYVSRLLFRGQANSEWQLKSTLEGFIFREVSL